MKRRFNKRPISSSYQRRTEENLNLKGWKATRAIVPSVIFWNFQREIARYLILENCDILFFCYLNYSTAEFHLLLWIYTNLIEFQEVGRPCGRGQPYIDRSLMILWNCAVFEKRKLRYFVLYTFKLNNAVEHYLYEFMIEIWGKDA